MGDQTTEPAHGVTIDIDETLEWLGYVVEQKLFGQEYKPLDYRIVITSSLLTGTALYSTDEASLKEVTDKLLETITASPILSAMMVLHLESIVRIREERREIL